MNLAESYVPLQWVRVAISTSAQPRYVDTSELFMVANPTHCCAAVSICFLSAKLSYRHLSLNQYREVIKGPCAMHPSHLWYTCFPARWPRDEKLQAAIPWHCQEHLA